MLSYTQKIMFGLTLALSSQRVEGTITAERMDQLLSRTVTLQELNQTSPLTFDEAIVIFEQAKKSAEAWNAGAANYFFARGKSCLEQMKKDGKEISELQEKLTKCKRTADVTAFVISLLVVHCATELGCEAIARWQGVNPEKNTAGFGGFCKDWYKRCVFLDKGSLNSKTSFAKLAAKLIGAYLISGKFGASS